MAKKKSSKSKKVAKIVGGVVGALAGAAVVAAAASTLVPKDESMQSLNAQMHIRKTRRDYERHGSLPKSLHEKRYRDMQYRQQFPGYSHAGGSDADIFMRQFRTSLARHHERGVHPDDIIDV